MAITVAHDDDPAREGLQLIARDESCGATGFAPVFWSWSTPSASRIGWQTACDNRRAQALYERVGARRE